MNSKILITILCLFIIHVYANTSQIGWYRLEEHKLNKNLRYVFSDGGPNEKNLKNAHIKFNITFVPENYEKLMENNETIRAFVIVLDSKDMDEFE